MGCLHVRFCPCSYKNAVDGLYQVWRKEGIPNLFNGASTATMRASVVSVGQISFYEQVKEMLLATPYFDDDMFTHFTASFAAVSHSLGFKLLITFRVQTYREGTCHVITSKLTEISFVLGNDRNDIDTTSGRLEDKNDECRARRIRRSHGLRP